MAELFNKNGGSEEYPNERKEKYHLDVTAPPFSNSQNKSDYTSDTRPEPKNKSFFREFFEFAFIALVIIIPFRMFVAQPFVVNGASMDPTFETGEYLIVEELSYHFTTPERGSVLIFKFPKDPSKFFIKRVIGLPGETVIIEGGIVTIKNEDNPQGFQLKEGYVLHEKLDSSSVVLENDEYFVLGDNRARSADSRVWGPMPEENIVGRPVLRLFPISRLGFLPGDKDQLATDNTL